MTLALPTDLMPWPIGQYPKNPPPKMTGAEVLDRLTLLALGAESYPECVAVHDGIEVPVRYEVTRDGDFIVHGVRINGAWADPAAWLPQSVIRCLENECRELEAELRETGE